MNRTSLRVLYLVLSTTTGCGDGGSDRTQSVVPNVCGNGLVEAGEACDDGLRRSPACTDDCRWLPACGDGLVQADNHETCDDGNLVAADGCEWNCQPSPPAVCGNGVHEVVLGEPCDPSAPEQSVICTPDCTFDVCGDGWQSHLEACDDGNRTAGDGCDAACALEFCGDDVVQPGLGEACEPGVFGPPCRWDCTFVTCGDGILDFSEACDDGNLGSGDGCTDECDVEVCGDGVVQPALGETCDDGAHVDGDGCSARCDEERCGDHVVQADDGETCDDGNALSGDGCNALCQPESCGDGVVQRNLGETCDEGAANRPGGTCRETCRLARCGDGHVQAGLGERCDDGNTAAFDGCDAACRVETIGAPGFTSVATFDADAFDVAAAPDGRTFIATVERPDGQPARIALLVLDGAASGERQLVHEDDDGPAGVADDVRLAVDGAGRVAVAWAHRGWADEPPFSVRVAVQDEHGAFGAPVALGPSVGPSAPPDLHGLDAGFLSTWFAPGARPADLPLPRQPPRTLRAAALAAGHPTIRFDVAVDPSDENGGATSVISPPRLLEGETADLVGTLLFQNGPDTTVARLARPVDGREPEVRHEVVLTLAAGAEMVALNPWPSSEGHARLLYVTRFGNESRLRSLSADPDGSFGPPADRGPFPNLWPGDAPLFTPLADDGVLTCFRTAVGTSGCTRFVPGEPPVPVPLLEVGGAPFALLPAGEGPPVLLSRLNRVADSVMLAVPLTAEAPAPQALTEPGLGRAAVAHRTDGGSVLVVGSPDGGAEILVFDPADAAL
jgi:cysteine-rich repeat protein